MGEGSVWDGNFLHRGMVMAVQLGGLAGEVGLGPLGDVMVQAVPSESVSHEALTGAHPRV